MLAEDGLMLFELTEQVRFEPMVGLHLLRFSRPSQSTTLAPLPRKAMLEAGITCGSRPLAEVNLCFFPRWVSVL